MSPSEPSAAMDLSSDSRNRLVLVVYTFCVACIPILAPQFRLYLAFLALIYAPTMARVARNDGGRCT